MIIENIRSQYNISVMKDIHEQTNLNERRDIMNTRQTLKTTIFATALMVSLSAGAAVAEMNRSGSMDEPRTAPVTQNQNKMQFSKYDQNSDNRYDNQEFATYTYYTVDYDNDNMISESEWDDYKTIWYEPYEISYDSSTTFDDYDTDNNGYIETSEFVNAYDTDLYASWDMDNDGYIETAEYSDAVNTYYDYDSNNVYVW